MLIVHIYNSLGCGLFIYSYLLPRINPENAIELVNHQIFFPLEKYKSLR